MFREPAWCARRWASTALQMLPHREAIQSYGDRKTYGQTSSEAGAGMTKRRVPQVGSGSRGWI